jgi:hypothetical protein
MIESIGVSRRIRAIGAIKSGPNRAPIDSIIPIRPIYRIASRNFLTKKLEAKYIGLFRITKVVNNIVYTLELLKEIKVYPTFYISLLEDYIELLETERD